MTVEAELRAVRVRYGLVEALHGVDLAFPAGRVTVLLGRNGAGRSTVLRALAGAVRPASGAVLWGGREVTAVPAHLRARAGLALVPAERAVFGALTVAEHLGAGAGAGEATGLFPELLPLLRRRAGTLSGGEQQMTALGRALAARPRLLLLDEPDRGLAPAVAARLHGRLLAAAALGGTVVVAAPALPAGLAGAGVVHVLHRGRVVFSGEPGELRAGAPLP
ncbi:ATP-binding cassette domain-containing protein [Kitasatospora sp. NBC_01539]|uniref:ATP-binding cassette domain-containing protein n=1 Tax=Kitasatospora sp. NBC_01539 TaxID=2903577 RepID=UPI0038601FD4